jgi:spore germination protein YaaH
VDVDREGAPGWTWRAGRRAAAVGLALTLLGGVLAPADPAEAADPAPTSTPLVTGWLPSWATDMALAGVEGNANLFGEASPFWYSARASGSTVSVTTTVAADTRARVVSSLRARGIAVIPSVVDGSAARAMAAVLQIPAARAEHVAQLVDLVNDNAYDGIELDYEKFAFSDGSSTWSTTRPAWVAFVRELSAGLRASGKKLAIAVPPMYDGKNAASSGYWVYDYAGIAPAVDSLRIMTYDYSVSRPGPIAPLSFLRRTLAYAVTAFPATRIRMGLPAYGRLWTARRTDGTPSITGTCPTDGVPGTRSFTTATALSYLAGVAGAPPAVRYDEVTGEMVASFAKEYAGLDADGKATSCMVDHEAWWVDARGVAARMPFVSEYGLAGVAVWQLAGVDAESWAAMQTFAKGLAPTPPPAAVGTVVTARPSTLRPKKGTKVKIRVQVTPKKKAVTVRRQMLVNGKWRTMSTKRTTAKGKVTFTFTWPKTKTSRTYRITTKKKGSLAAGKSTTFVLTTR